MAVVLQVFQSYQHLKYFLKHDVTVVAMAREIAVFMWAIAQEIPISSK
jgi:hypothetical protein